MLQAGETGMNGWMDGWTDGRTDGWTDGRTEGRTDTYVVRWRGINV
jgi:hypothetical protein